jgi:hypothetical protein
MVTSWLFTTPMVGILRIGIFTHIKGSRQKYKKITGFCQYIL